MIFIFNMPEDSDALDDILEENPIHHVWIDGDRIVVRTGEDISKDE